MRKNSNVYHDLQMSANGKIIMAGIGSIGKNICMLGLTVTFCGLCHRCYNHCVCCELRCVFGVLLNA